METLMIDVKQGITPPIKNGFPIISYEQYEDKIVDTGIKFSNIDNYILIIEPINNLFLTHTFTIQDDWHLLLVKIITGGFTMGEKIGCGWLFNKNLSSNIRFLQKTQQGARVIQGQPSQINTKPYV